MIERYTKPAMGKVFAPARRFDWMLEVEKTVAEVQAELKLIPADCAKAIRERGRFDVQRIAEIEATTKHDVIAFVTNVAENIGAEGRFVHFGLTSSDVLDTALNLQMLEAGGVLLKAVTRLIHALQTKARVEAATMCAGRTHGMHAEPTTFGMKLAGHWAEMRRNELRLVQALDGVRIGKLSGAVGTYSAMSHEVEAKVCERLGLRPETIATQVVPRDRHAEVFAAVAILGGGLERLAVELRHLQRTEVGEVTESFSVGQKGSSAMPHKKNPISAENVTGAARLLRSYAAAAMEDIALWHERDISHSSVERVIIPDAFILAHYAAERMADLIEGLEVNRERMLANMDDSQGMLMSSHLLLALVETGLSREDAYKQVQALSHKLRVGENLLDVASRDAEVSRRLDAKALKAVFSGERHKQAIQATLKRAGLWEKA